ncbi:winged helix-turn-helix transcriptional regulator [Halomarina ordinaria]|uniref:Winged helix-turn-helix transcriptional regulator n=1 Tax=Halomarina ordinaria TaxID=3033939 RepID=A0ABD5UGA9_9EURY|nr:winged helix-turn-helix transcriptional regulator [Halomarina sp. PSRA2]
MTQFDTIDQRILELLLADGRRSFRDIADDVGRSAPTISNRVERLEDLGVIERFTVQVDRTQFADDDACLLTVEARLGHAGDVFTTLRDADDVEHVFHTAASTVIAKVLLSPAEVQELVTDVLTDDQVRNYHIESVMESAWQPQLGTGDLDLECPICGKPIADDGETVEVESGDTYHVCCSSCAEDIVEQYEALARGTDE